MTTTFKTRARTLDMLGRQQIAGIPTAISELFKNAHDAYADNVEIDYYRLENIFVLRDDGIGMSKDDFVTRWLTIGTDSKFDQTRSPPPADPDKQPRPMLGEKGIGRLAIATIGPQILVLTRPKIIDAEAQLTVAFINWGIFEWANVNLEEIQIPLRTFPAGDLPSRQNILDLVDQFRTTVKEIGNNIGVEKRLADSILDELDEFDVVPETIDSYLPKMSLKGFGHGTHFVIKPASQLLSEDIDGDRSTSRGLALKKATPLKKALLGFTNTMKPNSNSVLRTAFRDHKTNELFDDLIGQDEFFTPEEFENTDHHIHGRFDESGQFKGEVSIYGELIHDHIISWTGSQVTRTDCGPFHIHFAAFEGENRHSTIPYEDHAKLSQKTEKIGGLYIYRNGIRIQPYGNTDYDWLDIEFRRTKSASYYYFSHRKMFGTIEIDAENNSDLKEKAGREGFQENKAYRQFRSILQNFFVQIAADFFRSEGMHAGIFDSRKAELSRENIARKHREQLVRQKKKNFQTDLENFFLELQKNTPQEKVLSLTDQIEKQLKATRSIADHETAAVKIIEIERKAKSAIRELEAEFRVSRPRIGLSKTMHRDWNAYLHEFSALQDNVFRPTYELIENLISEESQKAKSAITRRLRTEESLNDLGREARAATETSSRAIRELADRIAIDARKTAQQSLKNVELEFRAVLSDFQRTEVDGMSDEQFVQTRDALENRVRDAMEEQESLLSSILEELQTLDVTGKNSTVDQIIAIEQRNLLLEEEAEVDAQLVQLGMAIEIINHEFSATIRSIRNALRRLKAWADVNEELQNLYLSIRTSFDHLDGYLTLFTPLQRRLYRKPVMIRGSQIKDFLAELFEARLLRHHTTLKATKSFRNAKLEGYPSSFYPVFVNLMDNAIFWLSQQNPEKERTVTLDEAEGAWLVSDTGPGINIRDREAIFEFGFSRKPGGRGLGLHIGRESLRRVGFDLILIEKTEGATFGINPLKESQ